MNEALRIAVEHARWCRSRGIGTRAIYRLCGEPEPSLNPSWDDASILLAAVWITLDHTGAIEARSAR